MNHYRWSLLLYGSLALLLCGALIALMFGVSHAQVVSPPTIAPLATPYLPAAPAPVVRATPAPDGLQRTIVVVGEGQVAALPDLARLEIGVETLAPTVAEAVTTNEATLAEVIASLREYVAQADIRTISYNVYPERDYERGGLAPVLGYRVTNMVQVTVRDLDQIGLVLEAATGSGANQIFGVSFDLDAAARAQAESEARALASTNLRAHAEELAQLHQARLGQLLVVSEAAGANALAPYAYAEGAGGGGPTISPGELTVVVRLQATFAIAN